MVTIIRDYFQINKSRIIRTFNVIYFIGLLGILVLVIQKKIANDIRSFIGVSIVSAVFWAAIVSAFITVVGVLDAYIKGRRLARQEHMSIGEYTSSEEYRQHGSEALRRTDQERKWL